MENNCKISPRPKTVKEFFTTWYFWRPFLGISAGFIAGFLYYYFVEFNGDTFIITSDGWRTILLATFMGFWVTSSPCSRIGRKC
ncbi:MAG TPA: hypothetical protein VMV47_03705 [Bacteroidales bacterium]|nr:hypothetical protein [Bacteroidales bacterium]